MIIKQFIWYVFDYIHWGHFMGVAATTMHISIFTGEQKDLQPKVTGTKLSFFVFFFQPIKHNVALLFLSYWFELSFRLLCLCSNSVKFRKREKGNFFRSRVTILPQLVFQMLPCKMHSELSIESSQGNRVLRNVFYHSHYSLIRKP